MLLSEAGITGIIYWALSTQKRWAHNVRVFEFMLKKVGAEAI